MKRVGGSVLAALMLLGALPGCGGSSGDSELTIYVSAPLSGPLADAGRDVADGAELALADAGGEAAGTTVRLEVLDDAGPRGWDAARTGANARAATQDSTTIAYVGELDSGASRTSIPITNEAGVLQVSPGAGAVDLTREAIGSAQIPPEIQPSGARTFGRVIPSDRAQGSAAGGWLAAQGIADVAVVGGEDPFGAALLSGLESAPDVPPFVGPGDRAEATYLAQERIQTVAGKSIVPSVDAAIFGTDALLDPEGVRSLRSLSQICSTATECPDSPRQVRLTSAALDPTQLPPAAADFLAAFESEYGRPPGRFAAYGYEATAVVLDSIERADDPLDRGAVVDAFLATSERESILGTYSIDEVGDTTLAELGAYSLRGTRPVPEPQPLPAG